MYSQCALSAIIEHCWWRRDHAAIDPARVGG